MYIGGVELFVLIFMIGAILFLVAALLQWLWNITMPDVFNLKVINFWQAFRLLLIASILFGSGRIGS